MRSARARGRGSGRGEPRACREMRCGGARSNGPRLTTSGAMPIAQHARPQPAICDTRAEYSRKDAMVAPPMTGPPAR
jgi:hypothetical protein